MKVLIMFGMPLWNLAPFATNEHVVIYSGILSFGYSHRRGLTLPGSRLQTVFGTVRNGSNQSSV